VSHLGSARDPAAYSRPRTAQAAHSSLQMAVRRGLFCSPACLQRHVCKRHSGRFEWSLEALRTASEEGKHHERVS
jgi:hypothetical protein